MLASSMIASSIAQPQGAMDRRFHTDPVLGSAAAATAGRTWSKMRMATSVAFAFDVNGREALRRSCCAAAIRELRASAWTSVVALAVDASKLRAESHAPRCCAIA